MRRLSTALLPGLLTLTLMCGLALPACSEDGASASVRRDDEGFELPPEGRWYAGDLHVHATGASNDTGGDSTVPALAAMARKRGLSFIVLTDHSNSTGSDPSTLDEDPALFNKGPEFPLWQAAATASVPGELLVIDGNEISPVAPGDPATEPRGHVGCIPVKLAGFDTQSPFIDRPRGAVTGGSALTQALDRGCFAVVNHPYGPANWIRYDWSRMDYPAMEVWNGGLGYDAIDERAWAAWLCDLLAGRDVVPIAASDNHRVNKAPPGEVLHPALGYPRTWVYASELSWPAIMAGLRAGHVALGEGGSVLKLDAWDADKRRTKGPGLAHVRLEGALDAAAGADAELRLWQVTGCVDPRPAYDPPTLTRTLAHTETVAPGASFDIRLAVGGAGVWVAELRVPGSTHHAALSRAVVVP